MSYAAFPQGARADFTFVQITDTHIAVNANDPGVEGRYRETIRRVNALKPAFVIHTGDALANFSTENYALLKAISAGLKPKMYMIPGNHDAGNKPGQKDIMTGASYDAWAKASGYGYVAFEQEGCLFIGLTSMLFNSGLPQEREQFQWFKTQLEKAGKKRVFVFMHHPLFENVPGEPSGYGNIDEPLRSQLFKLFRKYKVEAVLYGHVHQFSESRFDGIMSIATPSVAFSVVEDKGLTGFRVFTVAPGGFNTHFVDLRKGGSPPTFGK